MVYAVQDLDRLGRPGSSTRLKPHRTGYFSMTFDHPGTPRVKGIPEWVAAQLAARGYPPARYEIAGPALPLIGEARVDAVIVEGWRSEIAWAARRGADPVRVAEMEGEVAALLGLPLVEAMRRLAAQALEQAGIRWPDNLRWTSMSALLDPPLRIAALRGYSSELVWSATERAGAANLPRGVALPIELWLRGYRLYVTRLGYWDRVAELARMLEVPVPPPRSLRVPHVFAPPEVELDLSSGERARLAAIWAAAWEARPTLIHTALRGRLAEALQGTELSP